MFEDVTPYFDHPPTAITAQGRLGRGFKFGMDTHLGNTYGVRRRLLKFHSLAKIRG